MPGEQYLALHLHELLTYLNNRGILTLMILAQMGLVGSAMQTPIDVSYLADNILAPVLRIARGGSPSHLNDEEAQRRARALDS
jgi:circadian clock protein KaiC